METPRPIEVVENYQLATRGQRLSAQCLNGLGLTGTIVIVSLLGLLLGVRLPNETQDGRGLAACVFAGFIIWGLINLRQLGISGQSLGKKKMGIRILKISGKKAGLVNLVVARYLSMQVLGAIPWAGPFLGMLDILLIFGVEKRCLHDYLAGTVVVKA